MLFSWVMLFKKSTKYISFLIKAILCSKHTTRLSLKLNAPLKLSVIRGYKLLRNCALMNLLLATQKTIRIVQLSTKRYSCVCQRNKGHVTYATNDSQIKMLSVEIMITERVNLGVWHIKNVILTIIITFTYL